MILIIAMFGCWPGIIYGHKAVVAAALFLHARPLQKGNEQPLLCHWIEQVANQVVVGLSEQGRLWC